MGFVYLAIGLALIVSAAAALLDWRTGHIPNWLTLGSACLAALLHAAYGALGGGVRGAASALISVAFGMIVCSLVPLFMYRANGMGGGDVKLLAAIGAICGPMIGLQAQFYSFVAIVLYAFAWLAYRGRLIRTLFNSLRLLVNPFLPASQKRPVSPEVMASLKLGPAILAGVIATALAHWRVG
jgi:prepilin peptidase CpaA